MKKQVALFFSIFCLLFCFCGCAEKEVEKKADFSDVKVICELATMKCYYHNTSELKVESTDVISKWLKVGYKKAWIEYDGIIKLGINAAEVKILPEEGNVVKIYVPDAQILSVEVETDSLNETVSETGIFTTITTEERAQAQAKAQEEMKTKAEGNTALLNQATQRAKEIIKGYVMNVGKQIGVSYEVEWITEEPTGTEA